MNQTPDYRTVLERAVEHGIRRLESLDALRVSAALNASELRSGLDRPLSDNGVDPLRVLDELVADASGGLIATQGGRFFAWVIGGSLPASLGADVLTSLWDQNAALHSTSPAHGAIEEVCGRWLKELLGIPEKASFALVTGTQMAHVTCLAAARSHLLYERGWDVDDVGLMGAPSIHVLTSTEVHGSLDRAVRLLGLGNDAITRLPVDEQYRLSLVALKDELARLEDQPVIVHLEAGGINTGAYDRFADIIPLAHENGAWVHVDGAIGLWAKASPRHRHLLEGSELADSWSADGHKWLNVPYDVGYAFVAHAERHRSALSYRASYLAHDAAVRDQMDYNPEWSRRGRGAATYAAIRELGRNGIAALVDRTCRLADQLTMGIGALEQAEVVVRPVINQALVRFQDRRHGTGDPEHDRFTDAVIEEIVADGEAFFQATDFMRRRCMRISLCSWLTNEQDVLRTITAVESAVNRVNAKLEGSLQ